MSEPVAWPECREFYELMQAYRHAPLVDQTATIGAYESVKEWLRAESGRDPVKELNRTVAELFARDAIERKDAAIAELERRAISCEQSYTRERAERAEMAIAELVGVLKECAESLGRFISQEEWAQEDMNTADSVDYFIAKYDIPKAES